MKEDKDMPANVTTSLRQTFRITIDVEVAFHANPSTQASRTIEEGYCRDLLNSLEIHSDVLTKLQHGLTVDTLSSAKKVLEVEYGWGRNSEQQLIQSIMEDLEPDAQAYFTEEIEDGVSLYSLGDVTEVTVKGYALTELAPLEGKA